MANLPVGKLKYLYYEKGYSAREVGKELGVSIDVVYKFMRKQGLRRRDFYEMNKVLFARKPLSFKVKKNLTVSEEKLKIAGIMLYWAEGAKILKPGRGTIDLANSDPEMVKLFLKFLREICGIDEKRLRGYLYCYANQDIEEIKQYWTTTTNIPPSQFIKPYVREDYFLECKREMKYGLIHVRYSDKKLLELILKWIGKFTKENI